MDYEEIKSAIDRVDKLKSAYLSIDIQELKKTLLLDFWEYVKYFHLHIYNAQYNESVWNKKLARKLEEYGKGKNSKRYLAISCPRGFGKSALLRYFVSWCFARERSCNFVYATFSDELKTRSARYTRDIMRSFHWERLFGVEFGKVETEKDNALEARDKQTDTTKATGYKLRTGSLGSGFVARTVLSGSAGFDAGNRAIIGRASGGLLWDDPVDPKMRHYPAQMQQISEAFDETFEGCLRSPHSFFIIVMQRLFTTDFVGWLKENRSEDTEFFIVPALDEKDETTMPWTATTEQLKNMRDKNPAKFAAQYMQNPIIYEGTLFSESMIKFYDFVPQIQQYIISTDFAFKKGESYDWTAFQLWGVGVDNKFYLLKWEHFKEDSVEVGKKLGEFFMTCQLLYPNLNSILYEKGVSNSAFIPSLEEKYPFINFIPFNKSGANGKVLQAQAAKEFFLADRVLFPNNPRPQTLINELLTFSPEGGSYHEDQMDATTQAVNFLGANSVVCTLFV